MRQFLISAAAAIALACLAADPARGQVVVYDYPYAPVYSYSYYPSYVYYAPGYYYSPYPYYAPGAWFTYWYSAPQYYSWYWRGYGGRWHGGYHHHHRR